jgi:hypothetical protein
MNTHQEAIDETRGPALQRVKSSSAHRIYIQLIIDPGGFDGGPLCVKTRRGQEPTVLHHPFAISRFHITSRVGSFDCEQL